MEVFPLTPRIYSRFKPPSFGGRVTGLVLLALSAFNSIGASDCHPFEVDEIRLGLLYHDLGVWSGSSNEQGLDVNGELIFSPAAQVLHGSLRPNLGFSLSTSGDTSKIYGGGVWEYRWPAGWFVDLGLGLAVHNGETEAEDAEDRNQLGSPVLFRLSFELGFTVRQRHQISIMFDHISNAYLAAPNEGLDTLGLRYGYRF